ncbi:MAG: putative cytochrome oxidase associated rane protein [Rhizobacter sp.]|nr:putative cytochrome oxidase associated rane protein [Rhizobacter sp.]
MNTTTHWQATLRGDVVALLIAAIACAHPWFEQTMARHMGLELPALFILGGCAAAHAGERLSRALSTWNRHGVPGLLFALCATSFWMVPAALDSAVLQGGVGLAKVASMVAAGLLTRASWRAAGPILQAFFVLNWAWMTLAAGLLYQQAPQQLCSVYLAEEQAQAGEALVLWAAAGLAAWLAHVAWTGMQAQDIADTV